MARKILITGATGNVGREVLRYLFQSNTSHQIITGVRDVEKAKSELPYPQLEYVCLDFNNPDTYAGALNGVETIFLLRPPHISDIKKVFVPFFNEVRKHKIKNIVFLSVQGVEKSKIIPHNKMEKLIKDYGFSYVFIRPGYFMQNLITTLRSDIEKGRIILPAGKAKFNWIDVENIGEATAFLLDKFENYAGKALDLTGYENENFETVVQKINAITGGELKYKPVNPLQFFFIKKKEGLPFGLIMVMMLLHFLPRFQKEPVISTNFEKLTGKKPTTLASFIIREKDKFMNLSRNS